MDKFKKKINKNIFTVILLHYYLIFLFNAMDLALFFNKNKNKLLIIEFYLNKFTT